MHNNAGQPQGIVIPFAAIEAVAQAGMEVTPIGETENHYVLDIKGGVILPIPVKAGAEPLLVIAHVMLLKNDVLQFTTSRVLGPDGQHQLVAPDQLFNTAVPAHEILQVSKAHIGSALKEYIEALPKQEAK